MKLINYLFCFTVFNICKHANGKQSTGSYYDGFIKYLQKESKLYQVMFIFDDQLNNTDTDTESLVKTVNKKFPSLSISSNLIDVKLNGKYLKSLESPRKTTLFVIYQKNNKVDSFYKTAKTLHYQKILSKGTSLPRCLIVQTFNSSDAQLNYSLQNLWLDRQLDITFLKLHQPQQNMLKRIPRKVPQIAYINPFFMKYSTKLASSDSQWFPNKLRNLNRYNLNFLFAIKNNVLYKAYYNEGTKLAQLLGQSMNFESVILLRHVNIKTYLSKVLEEKNAELWLNPIRSYNRNSKELTNSRVVTINNVKAVIPKTNKLTKVVVVSQEFWYMMLATIFTVCVIRFTAFMMRFEKSTWRTLNISQIIMGMSTEKEPENLPQRMVFGSLLIACMVYSGYFFSVILDIAFRPEPEISTLAELAASSLTPMTMSTLNISLWKSSIPHIRQLAKRSIMIPGRKRPYDCLRYLADYKNVTCIISDAEYYVNFFLIQKGEVNVKIIPETVLNYITTWTFRRYSPFADCFNEIIQRATDSGLLSFFYTSDVKFHLLTPPEEIIKEKILLVLFYVLATGYSLSFIALVIEMIVNFFTRRICIHG